MQRRDDEIAKSYLLRYPVKPSCLFRVFRDSFNLYGKCSPLNECTIGPFTQPLFLLIIWHTLIISVSPGSCSYLVILLSSVSEHSTACALG